MENQKKYFNLDETSIIQFTPELYREFKQLYGKAISEGKDEFEFKGNIVVTSYAKYVLEFLEEEFFKN